MIKIDMQKACDTVEWVFWRKCYMVSSFPLPLLDGLWIMACLNTVSYAININGQPANFFEEKRGLRQGDAMSPYLFLLVIEFLRRLLK